MMGWGAVCNGTTTQGLWSPSEKLNHINVLELKAAMFAVMAFAKNLSQIHIHLRLDNQASVAQINKLGGPRSHRLFQITKVFWDFCLSRQIIITADHVPGVQNQIADRESRVFLDKSCWILNGSYFQQIEKIWGEADIDLFADRLTTQKKVYVSWKPDPKALTTDAFTMQWADQKMYAFPPFCLVGLCLAKVRRDQASLTLIAPVWPAQTWYPTLLEMLVSAPILLPASEDLLHYSPKRSSTSIDSVTWADSSGVESLRGRLQTAGFSQESSDLLLESRRSGTRAAYKAPWKRWWGWCVERKVDPLQASVGYVAIFFTSMLNDRGLKYSTLNLHRSAISAYHPPVEGFQVGQHPLIMRLLKGAFNKKPPQPRYTQT